MTDLSQTLPSTEGTLAIEIAPSVADGCDSKHISAPVEVFENSSDLARSPGYPPPPLS
jgi:hypothetical protein